MMNKKFFVQTISCALITTSVFGALSYSIERFEPKEINLSGFKNALSNIEHISSKTQDFEPTRVSKNVTEVIVATIEREVKKKISASRNKVTSHFNIKRPKPKYNVVIKNWNEIKPSFPKASLVIDSVSLVSSATSAPLSPNEFKQYEINNNEMISLKRFYSEMINVEYFANSEIQQIEVESKIVENNIEAETAVHIDESVDEVNLTQSAEITNDAPVQAKLEVAIKEVDKAEDKNNDDDLVMFDYSKPTAKKIFDGPISSAVKEAIEREIHTGPKDGSKLVSGVNTQKPKLKFETTMDTQALKDAMNSEDSVIYDYTTKTQAAPVQANANAFMGNFEKKNEVEMTTLKLTAKEINMGTHSVRMANGFEFVPDYERSERMDDQAIGEIKFDYSLDKSMSIQTGVVQSLGNIPTRVEIDLLRNEMTVPLINEEGIQKYLEKRSLNIVGSLIMVAVDESIQDVEIDREYQGKIYLNKNYKTLPSSNGASYVMILGVSPGNVMLRYLLSNNANSQKIIYLGDGEMYYEDPIFNEGKREVYNFSTRSLLGKKVKELNIQADKVGFFGAKVTSKKKALNAYEINVPTIVKNERKYLEFKHLDATLYVGTQNLNEIEVPGQDFINKVLEQKDMRNLGQRCLIQINLSKDIRDIKANGKNKQGEMFVELNYLDNDGNFSNETPELAEKVFIGGDQEGLIGIRVDYSDGSTGFLKSYCSEGSYLVEQL